MSSIGWRSRSKRAFWPLISLAGLALIIYYAPLSYRVLKLNLGDGEQIVGFRGQGHELIVLAGGPTAAERKQWSPLLPPGIPDRLGNVEPEAIHQKIVRVNGDIKPVPLGRSVFLWNLDHDVKMSLPLEGALQGLYASPDGTRILIVYWLEHHVGGPQDLPGDFGQRMAVFDGETHQRLQTRTINEDSPLRTSRDGKVLIMRGGRHPQSHILCVDTDTGRELYSVDGLHAVLSPNGKYLAVSENGNASLPYKPPNGMVINLDRHSLTSFATTISGSFSLDSERFIDGNGGVWDLASNKLLYSLPGPGIFVDEGKKLAWTDEGGKRLVLRFRDVKDQRDLPDRDIYIPGPQEGSLEAIGTKRNLIRLEATGLMPELTRVQKVLNWLGFKQTPSTDHQWVLIDARSGEILHRGRDELIAVSADAQYVISGDEKQTRLNLYELPGHRSMPFMAVACAVWIILILVGRRLWRRRLKPLVEDVSETALAPGET
jgi:hypothetical protein